MMPKRWLPWLSRRRLAADASTPWEDEDAAPCRRLAVILRARKPCLVWANGLLPGLTQTLTQMRADAVVYLVPTVEFDPAEALVFVETHYARFFAQELALWTTDQSRWPAERTLALFQRWFEVEVIDRVIDVG